MNLYLVERDENDDVDYDDHRSIIVAAETEADARRFHPGALFKSYPDDPNDVDLSKADHLAISENKWDKLRVAAAENPEYVNYVYSGWVRETLLDTLKVTLLGPCTAYDKPHFVLGDARY